MEPHAFNLLLACFGAILLVLSLSSGLIKNRWFISEPTVALLAGIALGPFGLGWVDLSGFDSLVVLEQVARFTLAIALIEVAMRLPHDYLRRSWRTLGVFLGLLLPLMWLTGSLLALLLVPVAPAMAFLIGAVVAPTDPVVGGSVVSGQVAERSLPERLRHSISAESGANDVLALPFVMLPVYLITHPDSAWHDFLLRVLLLEVALGAALGAVAGYVAGRALRWAGGKKDAERHSLLGVSLALAVTLLGAVRLAESDGLLAAFIAGLVLNQMVRGEIQSEKERLHETIKRFFDLPAFVVLGIALPFARWLELGGAVLVFAVLVLLLRRLPAMLALRRVVPPLETRRDALFVGWFGPIGIAALYYATHASKLTGSDVPWVVGSLVICLSVVAHGTTATWLTQIYGKRAQGPRVTSTCGSMTRKNRPSSREFAH